MAIPLLYGRELVRRRCGACHRQDGAGCSERNRGFEVRHLSVHIRARQLMLSIPFPGRAPLDCTGQSSTHSTPSSSSSARAFLRKAGFCTTMPASGVSPSFASLCVRASLQRGTAFAQEGTTVLKGLLIGSMRPIFTVADIDGLKQITTKRAIFSKDIASVRGISPKTAALSNSLEVRACEHLRKVHRDDRRAGMASVRAILASLVHV